MAAPKPSPSEHLFNPSAESDPGPKPWAVPVGAARRWLEGLGAGLRPWGSFLQQSRFGVPRDLGELCRRLPHNLQHFHSNYLCLAGALLLYCLVSSPLLLVALGVCFGACYGVRLRAQQGPLVVMGRELSPPQQYGLAAGVSLPLFWLAGAGAALFWVLGAALVVIGSHAALRQPDPPETPSLQMEPI